MVVCPFSQRFCGLANILFVTFSACYKIYSVARGTCEILSYSVGLFGDCTRKCFRPVEVRACRTSTMATWFGLDGFDLLGLKDIVVWWWWWSFLRLVIIEKEKFDEFCISGCVFGSDECVT